MYQRLIFEIFEKSRLEKTVVLEEKTKFELMLYFDATYIAIVVDAFFFFRWC